MGNKVLVVDDSALMRKVLRQVLSEAGFEVESARSGREGIELAQTFEPDVVTLDVNMPEMDGLTALSLLMAQRPTPVIMVSSLTTASALPTLEALALGAVDYIAKPGGTISLNLNEVAADLVQKVRTASTARVRTSALRAMRPDPARARSPLRARPVTPAGSATGPGRTPATGTRQQAAAPNALRDLGRPDGLVLIGVSTGGPRTLEDILPALPADFPWPVLVCQHMPAQFTSTFAQRMDSLCALEVRECDGPTPLQPGQVVIARGGYDMVITERLGRLVAQPVPEAPAQPWHPCVDVLVDSAMRQMPADRLVGVLLTGMGFDGAASMARLHQQGGRTIAESAESAVVFGMPQELINRQGADRILHASRVSDQLRDWICKH
ncbi:chemotaxis-specific protein-glutamate methyltransferase CheB [Pelomonas sp. UHG3]|uniref:Chemotaxis-specific protein-glutamate methyltransferase CheB n=1 Tax=Roseateles hydrophilus TaxID=2975054 RepID=A0ACC6C6Y9_9BURK|nr:chemotaxis-specific protein-glutamate methyltransferase CheB [Pelomonas sp. UHG3]MCY4744176.1 chemotaxis-specific protein-glutamate methyltransferase CheB [Pelomonas sp. UHG3]